MVPSTCLRVVPVPDAQFTPATEINTE